MLRRLVPIWVVLALGSSASAEPGERLSVVREPTTPAEALAAPTIYINRCAGGCMVMPGTDDDATTTNPTSGIVAQPSALSEFMFSQQVWDEMITCLKEVYSPFNVQIVETRPTGGTQYHHAIVAGTAEQAGLPSGVLGIAIVRGDCAPRNNAVSLSLANSHPNTGTTGTAQELCWTVAQESAHAFGLDHSFMFQNGRSACNDPMTYRRDCGGQKFFRNDAALCGTTKVAACNCGTTQNSHGKLLTVFGANEGTQLVGPPTSTITSPTASTANNSLGANVVASSGSKRGVARVELIVNGFKWAEVVGAPFGAMGQPNPSNYQIAVPAMLPNGVSDLIARSCDDLNRCTDSPTITVTKGTPCADASTCAKGQKCEAGKCFWDPPVGQIGDACTYNEFCESLMCSGDEGAQVCSKNCVPNTADACPMDFECIPTGTTAGFCYPKDSGGGGCCSVGGDDGPSQWFVHGGLSLALLGLLVRRRRTRK